MNTKLKTKTVSFTTNGRVTISAHFRREFQIEDGTKAALTSTPEGILLRPITRSYIRSLRGSLKGKNALNALAAVRKQERVL